MKKRDFPFQNQEQSSLQVKKEPLSEKAIKSLIVFSSLIVAGSFLAIKTLWFIHKTWTAEKSKVVQKDSQDSRTFPLLVNLKGVEGPQLARVHVHVTFNGDSSKTELISQKRQLEKSLLFILSGQSTEVLNQKKNHFEKQILSQLNVLLAQNSVSGVQIQMEMLN